MALGELPSGHSFVATPGREGEARCQLPTAALKCVFFFPFLLTCKAFLSFAVLSCVVAVQPWKGFGDGAGALTVLSAITSIPIQLHRHRFKKKKRGREGDKWGGAVGQSIVKQAIPGCVNFCPCLETAPVQFSLLLL